MKKVLVLLLLVSYLSAFELLQPSHYSYPITQEKELLTKQPQINKNFFASQKGYFEGESKIRIFYRIFKVPKAIASIVISSGRTESLGKYKELIYDLNHNGFNVYIMDHRGQGDSGRLTEDPQLGHVNDFENYIRDLHTFIQTKVIPDKPYNLFLVAHSMGGAIGGLYIEEHPDVFDAAFFSSPMMQPTLGAPLISGFMCEALSLKDDAQPDYAPGTQSYDNENRDFVGNTLTHSQLRYSITEKTFAKNAKEKVGGPSLQWVVQSCEASQRVVENANKITIPFLLLQAGEDKIVNAAPQKIFCKNAQTQCSAYTIGGAYHELFVESDIYRNLAITNLITFFKANLKLED